MTLHIVTTPGTKANEILLTVTAGATAADAARIALGFAGLPDGAMLFDANGQNVGAGIADFAGSGQFRLVLAADADSDATFAVTATELRADDSVAGTQSETVDIDYDVATAQADMEFSSNNQNMWGNFDGYIGWHEYIPLIGGSPVEWDEDAEEWTDVTGGGAYWRSGEFTLADYTLSSDVIEDKIADAAQFLLNGAKKVFDQTAYVVDSAVQAAYDLAVGIYEEAKETFYEVAGDVDAAVQSAFDTAKGVYNAAVQTYNAASNAFNTVATGLHDAAWNHWTSYTNWYYSLDWWGQFWNAAGYAVEAAAWGVADLAYQTAKGVWWVADQAFNAAGTGAKAVYLAAQATYNAAKAVANEAAAAVFDTAEAAFNIAENVYNAAKQTVLDGAQAIYDGVQDTVDALIASNPIDFTSRLKVDADVFAQAGLKVDLDLDLGSVDTKLDYQLTSTTQYNKTIDMLAVLPTLLTLNTGDSVVFDTISPNAKFKATILYDIGADIEATIDGTLKVAGTTLFDLNPGTTAPITLDTTVSTNAWPEMPSNAYTDGTANSVILDLIRDMTPGELVLIDFDSTEDGGPFEVPFIDQLLGLADAGGILTIELAFPTVQTEGTADTFTLTDFQEGGAVSVDFSEISDTIFNIIQAKIDYSPELKELANIDTELTGGHSFDELVETALQAFSSVILDMLDGNSEQVPIFLIDTTDTTSTSLLHINTFGDDAMGGFNANTGNFGFYTAYGESDPIINVNIDIDQAVAFIVNKIAAAIVDAVSAGAAAPATEAIPTINPLNLSFGIDEVLKLLGIQGDESGTGGSGGTGGTGGTGGSGSTGDTVDITDFIDFGLTFEAADLDTAAAANFSQEFSLSIDDMTYLLTLEDGYQQTFSANAGGALTIAHAMNHDSNDDGVVDYSLNIVPTALFSNDTELGLELSYVFDLLKGEFNAGFKLPIADLLNIPGLPDIEIPAISVGVGPLLRVEGDLDALDVDVFEDRFALDVGSDSYTGSVSLGMGANSAPSFGTTLDGTPEYTEGAAAVVLDASVAVVDAELTAKHYAGASLTLQRHGGASADDRFSASGQLGALVTGADLVLDGVTIGTVTQNGGGRLVLGFNAAATQARVDATLSSLAYANAGSVLPASISLDWTFADGNATKQQGTGGVLTSTGSLTVKLVDIAPAGDSTQGTSTVVDGATVTTGTTTTSDGRVLDVITIQPVAESGADARADVGLFHSGGTGNTDITTVSLPSGVGLTATGTSSPTSNNTVALSNLEALLTDSANSSGEAVAGAEAFLHALDDTAARGPTVVNAVTLTVASGTTAPTQPITISGTADVVARSDGSSGVPVEVLVIDVRQLPTGTVLELENIEFAVIVGDGITIRGGEGANIVFAGSGSQNIVLGADDDELHGGDGDDVIGSAAGNDALHGDAGNDTVYGGEGNDTLWGGAGDDTLNGDSGNNTVSYSDAESGVKVRLGATRTQDTRGAGSDSLDNFQNVVGSDFADVLKGTGHRETNVITGGAGADTLSGRGGRDVFQYLDVAEGGDTITDFATGRDTLAFLGSSFGGLESGTLAATRFVLGTVATTADQRFVFDTVTARLYFDADGSGEESAILIGTLRDADLQARDIVIL